MQLRALGGLVLLTLGACQQQQPVSLPSVVAYRLPLRELAAEVLPRGTTWGRPTARPQLVQEAGNRAYRVQASCSFVAPSASSAGAAGAARLSDFIQRLEPKVLEELARRGAELVSAHAKPDLGFAGSTLDVRYSFETIGGELHVEVRRAPNESWEFFYVVHEWSS